MNQAFIANAVSVMTDLGIKIIGALVMWFVGRWFIGFVLKLIATGLEKRNVESTLQAYVKACISGLLNVILIVSILGQFGVQTATFAAVLAAMGFAIGAAWSGLLAHFAAGVFIIVLRPFKVGDFICAGGVTGTVAEIGPFATVIDTPDNVHTTVGNNKILSDNIQNYTANPFRRVDLTAQLNHGVDLQVAVAALKTKLAAIPNVMETPRADVELLEFTAHGPKLAVRPYCHNDHYWQVYFATNEAIQQVCSENRFTVPEQHVYLRNMS